MNAILKRPTPAFVVALVALFFALGGTAGAIATQAVPLAKRALVADNAKKVGGQTVAQLSAQAVKTAVSSEGMPPGSASGAAAGSRGCECKRSLPPKRRPCGHGDLEPPHRPDWAAGMSGIVFRSSLTAARF